MSKRMTSAPVYSQVMVASGSFCKYFVTSDSGIHATSEPLIFRSLRLENTSARCILEALMHEIPVSLTAPEAVELFAQ